MVAGGAATVLSSVAVGNGVLHTVDAVLPLTSIKDMPLLNLRTRLRDAQLTDFLSAVDAAGLGPLIDAPGPPGVVTIFAPDAASMNAQNARWAGLRADSRRLAALLRTHIIPGYYSVADLRRGSPGVLVSASRRARPAALRYGTEDGRSVVLNEGQARIVRGNLSSSNGIAHVISGLLHDVYDPGAVGDGSVRGVVAASSSLSTLASLLSPGGVEGALGTSTTSLTLFAPADSAFDYIQPGQLAYIRRVPGVLAALLRYHVVAGQAVPAAALVGASPLTTAQSGTITVSGTPQSGLFVGSAVVAGRPNGAATARSARVQRADVVASNGIVHIIDAVLADPASAWAAALPVSGIDRIVAGRVELVSLRRVVELCGT